MTDKSHDCQESTDDCKFLRSNADRHNVPYKLKLTDPEK